MTFNLLSTAASVIHMMSPEQRMEYIAKRDQLILDAFKIHKTPTATSKALDGKVTRWVVMRIAMRAGLWTPTAKEIALRERNAHVDRTKSIYNARTKLFENEEQFQGHLSRFLETQGLEFHAEVQITGGQGRADFIGADFVIEAKASVAHDDICRGLGQCVTYRHCFPGKRIALVYPDDLEHSSIMGTIFANNGFSIMPFSHLTKWLP